MSRLPSPAPLPPAVAGRRAPGRPGPAPNHPAPDHSAPDRVAPDDAVALHSVLIIDDHPLFCEALLLTLKSVVEVGSVHTADRLDQAMDWLDDGGAPAAVLLDLNLPDVQGLDGLIRLKQRVGTVPVIVVSSLAEPGVINAAIQAGAAGFIPKHSARDVFHRAFRTIRRGEVFLPDGHVAHAGTTASTDDQAEAIRRLADLTPQQARILQLICRGKLNKQIAHDMTIAETTVKAHITAILRKLGVQSRTQAVLIAQNARFEKLLHDTADGS